MQAVGITSSGHYTSRELIYDKDLIVLYHIVLIPVHKIICTEGKYNTVLYLKVFGIRQVFQMEELLHLLHALLRKVYYLILFIDDKIPCLLYLHTHDGVHLGELIAAGFAPLQLVRQYLTGFVHLRGFSALSGNNKRRPGFIYQDGVHLIDYRVMEISENQLVLVDRHVISKIVKSQLVIGDVGDVTGIGLLSFRAGHAVLYKSYGESQEFMDLSHLLGITLCQIVIYGHHEYALFFKGIQIGGKSGHKGLTFTCTHLRDTSLVEYDAADYLNREVLHIQNTPARFTYCCVSLGKDIVQCLPFGKLLFELHGLGL